MQGTVPSALFTCFNGPSTEVGGSSGVVGSPLLLFPLVRTEMDSGPDGTKGLGSTDVSVMGSGAISTGGRDIGSARLSKVGSGRDGKDSVDRESAFAIDDSAGKEAELRGDGGGSGRLLLAP